MSIKPRSPNFSDLHFSFQMRLQPTKMALCLCQQNVHETNIQSSDVIYEQHSLMNLVENKSNLGKMIFQHCLNLGGIFLLRKLNQTQTERTQSLLLQQWLPLGGRINFSSPLCFPILFQVSPTNHDFLLKLGKQKSYFRKSWHRRLLYQVSLPREKTENSYE